MPGGVTGTAREGLPMSIWSVALIETFADKRKMQNVQWSKALDCGLLHSFFIEQSAFLSAC
jgi:hypothetical protein